ncbi:hypothetical protein FACS189472_15990 [Alphaproteobacteria bacterium]|nr:hypothetical protein FACS189472_15990 [Alphaproteobacteria bacterium]
MESGGQTVWAGTGPEKHGKGVFGEKGRKRKKRVVARKNQADTRGLM